MPQQKPTPAQKKSPGLGSLVLSIFSGLGNAVLNEAKNASYQIQVDNVNNKIRVKADAQSGRKYDMEFKEVQGKKDSYHAQKVTFTDKKGKTYAWTRKYQKKNP